MTSYELRALPAKARVFYVGSRFQHLRGRHFVVLWLVRDNTAGGAEQMAACREVYDANYAKPIFFTASELGEGG